MNKVLSAGCGTTIIDGVTHYLDLHPTDSRKRNYNKNGKRKHWQWSLDNFNDGTMIDGRMIVFYPNHHRAYKDGRVLRSIVAYEAYHPNEIDGLL